MNIEFCVILDSTVVEYIQHLICEFTTTLVFPILSKTNYLLLMGKIFSSKSLSCKVQAISFELRQKLYLIKARSYIEAFCGKTVKVLSSKFEKAILYLVIWYWSHELQRSIYLPNNRLYGLKDATPPIPSQAKEVLPLWRI